MYKTYKLAKEYCIDVNTPVWEIIYESDSLDMVCAYMAYYHYNYDVYQMNLVKPHSFVYCCVCSQYITTANQSNDCCQHSPTGVHEVRTAWSGLCVIDEHGGLISSNLLHDAYRRVTSSSCVIYKRPRYKFIRTISEFSKRLEKFGTLQQRLKCHRNFKTQNERKATSGHENDYGQNIVRPKRRHTNLPCKWKHERWVGDELNWKKIKKRKQWMKNV